MKRLPLSRGKEALCKYFAEYGYADELEIQ